MALGALIGLVVGALGMPALHRTLNPVLNSVSQKAYGTLPNELAPPTNLINLRYRKIIDETYYNDAMLKQGFDNNLSGLLYQGSESLLNGYEVIHLWRRGVIDEEERNIKMAALNFTPEAIEHLVSVTEFIPNPRDIIGFAVREVYTPEIAERFGQYQGADEVYRIAEDDLKATGMSKEIFRKFWAAHWQLPSMSSAYEMLHRKVIEESDIDSLMEAADIMPFWRDKLKAISYSPYTRVDVRRMHKLGIMDDVDLVTAYMDLGYDEEKATGLADFTIQYNLAPEDRETTEEDKEKQRQKEATRASILRAYRNSVIKEDEVTGYLMQLGYTDAAISLDLANEAFALEEDVTALKISTLHEAFIKRIYTYNEAVTGLGKLNLPAKQQESLLERWSIELEARGSRPSKAELFKFFGAKIITEETLRKELAGYGYNNEYINWYMTSVKKT